MLFTQYQEVLQIPEVQQYLNQYVMAAQQQQQIAG